MEQVELTKKMIALADKDNLLENHELRTIAKAFDEACHNYFEKKTINSIQFIGAWTRARKCYCDYTGESLI